MYLSNARLYPQFDKEVVDVGLTNAQRQLFSYAYKVTGTRRPDLISVDYGPAGKAGEVFFHENPLNQAGPSRNADVELGQWTNKLQLRSMRSPTSCAFADISGNGFNDVILTCEYGRAPDAPDAHGGRVAWLENPGTGTDEGDWTRYDIGWFPGVDCVKVGHFTTTFSLQVLALVISNDPSAPAPLIIYTKPSNIYKRQMWLSSFAMEGSFDTIQGCIVVKGNDSELDHIVLSCRQGLVGLWYTDRRWNSRKLQCNIPPSVGLPGQLVAGKIKQDSIAFMVFSEASQGRHLSILVKMLQPEGTASFSETMWNHYTIDTFYRRNASGSVSIRDVVCADIDGDGVDEILVSVLSEDSRSGLFCYDLSHGQFVKYKIAEDPVERISLGHFTSKMKVDLATVSSSFPPTISLHVNSFVPSEIKACIHNSDLAFRIPRIACMTSEVDVIDIAGRVLSLIVLPPNGVYPICPDGSDAVKVLHGHLGWLDARSARVERTRAPGASPGCAAVQPMLVDSPEGTVRSGDAGAVFVRLRPSSGTGDVRLAGRNVVPTYLPYDIREHEFRWRVAHKQPWYPSDTDSASSKDIYHLPGFLVQFDDPSGPTDVACAHFWSFAPGVSMVPSNCNISPFNTREKHQRGTCSIRACLSNPNGDGGLLIWDGKPGTSRWPTRLVLPAMYEHAPIWKYLEGNSEEHDVLEYPWHAWTAGHRSGVEREKWDIWASFDFPPFAQTQSNQTHNSCNLC